MASLQAFALSMSYLPCPECGRPLAPPYRCGPGCRKVVVVPVIRPYTPRSQLAPEQLSAARAQARKNWHGACSRCGEPMHVGPRSLPPDRRMCQACRRQEPQRVVAESRVCDLCEEFYVPRPKHRPGQQFCSKSCKTAWQNGARPPYERYVLTGRPRKTELNRIRRTRRAETWDGITDAEIFERDRWRCGICGERIDKALRWPHPRSPSIDHVIPIAEDGDDTAPNKRAAHIACNCGRGNRGGGEQLAMIG